MPHEPLVIELQSAIEVLRDLSVLVASFDNLDACAINLTDERYNQIVSEFLEKWSVSEKLSKARRLLSEPFSDELGDDGMDELEREAGNVRYWSYSNRRPQ